MSEFLTVLGAVLPVFTIMGGGFLLRRLNWLTEEADQSLMRVTINGLIPCLILDSVMGNVALRQPANVLLAPVVGCGTILLGIGLAWLIRPLAGLHEPVAGRTFAYCTGIYNYCYVPLPLALLLFQQRPETVGVLFVHNLGVEIAFWTFGLMLLSGVSVKQGWRKAINAPVIAIGVGLALNYLNGPKWVPTFLLTAAHMLGLCAFPMGILLIGAVISDEFKQLCAQAAAHPEPSGHSRGAAGRAAARVSGDVPRADADFRFSIFQFPFPASWRVMLAASFLRLGVLPLLFLLLARYLPCSAELKSVIVLEAAMPAAVFPIVVSKHYGGDLTTALRVVLSTSVAGLVTIPLWIRFGLKFVGL